MLKYKPWTGRRYLQYLYIRYTALFIYKEFLRISRQETNNHIEKQAKDVNMQFTERKTKSETTQLFTRKFELQLSPSLTLAKIKI